MKEIDNVIGYEDVKAELMRICDSLRNTGKYRAIGANTPRGLLLHGEPGLGKTLMARCFVEASGREAFICRKDLPNGEFVKEIKRVFDKAKQNAPSIVFLDDMDKFANEDAHHRNAEEFITVQSCIDDVRGKEVFVLATANDLNSLPSSLLRTGRFDKSIEIVAPKGACAKKIVEHYLSQKKCAENIDCGAIACVLEGRSCSDLETVVNEAGIYAAYAERNIIEMSDLVQACMRVLYDAPELLNENDTEYLDRTAYHEAGHALIAELLDPGSVNFVSVSARRHGINGFTSITKPTGYFHSKRLMENHVISILGGKAASEVVFGEVDTGSNSDLHHAFEIVERFVDHYCSFGFDEWVQNHDTSNILLDRKESRIASEMQRYYDEAKRMLFDNRFALDMIAKKLIEHKTLLGDQVRSFCGQSHGANER